jgi:hypothetical protein
MVEVDQRELEKDRFVENKSPLMEAGLLTALHQGTFLRSQSAID